MKRLGLVLIICASVCNSGCSAIIASSANAALTEADVKSKTIEYFGAKSQDISFTDIESHSFNTTYHILYQEKKYNCVIQYDQVSCREPGTY